MSQMISYQPARPVKSRQMSIKVPKNERYSKLALNVGDLGKIIAAKGFEKVVQSAKNAQSGHSKLVTSHLIFDIKNYKL